MEKHNVIIVGSGPAGYTAAIYAARANMKPIMYMGLEPGGQLMQTTDVENYPGYADGVMGPQMMNDFKAQAERFGTDIRYGMITKVDFSKRPFTLTIDDEKQVQAETVILATGASAKWLGIESEKRLNGRGVSACAVCDGFFYKNTEVGIVGAGDTAAEEALYLSKLCTKVHMLVRRDEMRASKIMQDRVLKTKNIEVYWNTETDEILGAEEVEGVRILNNKTGDKKEIPLAGFFVAIGHKPNSDVFKDFLDTDDVGYVLTKADSSQTNVEGVYACGDLQDSVFRQAVTAAGTGCMAALEAERFLAEKEII
ncbi:MAG: thioredoxin-disulfide reductase [Chitinophagales bacterium]|jgi:thioredoxin reductase (NADPH)|nr:thioredoxin reductase [uncultured bacterium]|tara:strand:- start:9028 stop:9960 length:933 start_codon:yes stop_codon:yes gene_type:complete